MMKLKAIATVMIAGLMSATPALAEHHEGKGGKHGMCQMMGKKALKGLDLTEAQRTEIKALMEANKPSEADRDAMKAKRKEHHQQMQSLVTATSFDSNSAKELLAAQQEKHLEKMLKGLEMKNKIYNLLTPEQQAKYQEKMAKCASKGH